jgi:hypothetical protein
MAMATDSTAGDAPVVRYIRGDTDSNCNDKNRSSLAHSIDTNLVVLSKVGRDGLLGHRSTLDGAEELNTLAMGQ